MWPATIGLALLGAVAIALAADAFALTREKKLLTRPPADGQWSALCGPMVSSTPVRAPLSGEPVAAYEYAITRDDPGTRSPTTYFYGKALTPASIGTVRLLIRPALDVEEAALEKSRAIANAREYVRTASFQAGPAFVAEDVLRVDHKQLDAEPDESFQYEERHIRNGETVCAFGVFSAAQNALVANRRGRRPARIVRGSASEIAKHLGRRALVRVVSAAVLGAIAATGALAYLR